jgi:enterochelin esterase family protein
VGGAEFPRLESDGGVTFQIKAPQAESVKLEGGAGLVAEPLSMRRVEGGVWTVTTPPAVPGFHYYWFMVDGLRVNDPSSYAWFGWGRETSGVEIPDSGVDFYHAKPEVPHGEVRERWYWSDLTGAWRRAHVYTPAEYDRRPRARYPVLYLLHGAGENERGWVEQGRAGFILDNLIAEDRARPMILVVDSGYAAYARTNAPAGAGAARPANAAFEEVLLTELIPMIDATYRTRSNRINRAMAGLSMGGGQTLNIALRHPEQFAWIGAFSSPPRGGFEVATAYDGAFRNPATFNKRVRLLWIGAGTAETRFLEGAKAMHEALETAGIENVFYASQGTDHEWQTWRRSLHDFAPRLFQP